MDINAWPRHQLRAQGRLRSDPRTGYRKLGTSAAVHAQVLARRSDRNDSATKSAQLLNFLSRTAAEAERTLLQSAPVPDFAVVKNSLTAEFDVNDLIARKRKSMVPVAINTITVSPESTAEGLLGKLADTIADAAMATVSANSPVISEAVEEHNYERDFAIALGDTPAAISVEAETTEAPIAEMLEAIDPTLEGDGASIDAISICNSISELELNEWFNCLFDSTDGDSDHAIEFIPELTRTSGTLLPAALPPVMPNVDDSIESAPVEEAANVSGLRQRVGKVRRNRGKLFKRLVIDQPRIAGLPGGERIERFDNGAELKKDALGRVRHIRSGLGISIAVAYDSEGQPQSFVRAERSGQMHSIGERDKHGVVVRDLEGRVRAAGESMSVDPSGCLSVRRMDGQFWSIDLVKELHIERRSIVGKDGCWNFLTAVFAADGFRLMTRFQHLQDEDGPANDRFHWLAAEPTGTFRFYGRDGSVIEFEGEDHLTAMKPQNVWAPGSRAIDPNFRGNHQAGTAWDSVQEYVTSYLSA